MSGRLTCIACNTVGCDSATENIFVSGEKIFLACFSQSFQSLFFFYFCITLLHMHFENITDGNGGFGIIEPKQPVSEGDDFELICAASIYNYTNIFEWSYKNSSQILENSNYLPNANVCLSIARKQ